MKKTVFNGKRMTEEKNVGVGRHTTEIINEFDKICEGMNIEVLIPECAENIPVYKNIKVVKFGGKRTGRFWEQTSFLYYLIKNRATGVNLDGTPPLLKPDITCKHDVTHLIAPDIYDSGSNKRKIARYWHKMIDLSLKLFAKKILTLSEFSKANIIKYFGIKKERVTVIGCGWQHFDRIKEDTGIFKKYPSIIKKEYFFAVGCQNKNKNFEWIINNAKLYPQNTYVIAGKYVKQFGDKIQYNTVSNILYLGYVSDGELKALMRECKAFIFPSFYEGFGIPPIEAMSVGAEVVISNSSCLPEIYENAAHYIDPDNYNVDLNLLLKEKLKDPPQKILDKYSWEKSAEKLKKIIFETTG